MLVKGTTCHSKRLHLNHKANSGVLLHLTPRCCIMLCWSDEYFPTKHSAIILGMKHSGCRCHKANIGVGLKGVFFSCNSSQSVNRRISESLDIVKNSTVPLNIELPGQSYTIEIPITMSISRNVAVPNTVVNFDIFVIKFDDILSWWH